MRAAVLCSIAGSLLLPSCSSPSEPATEPVTSGGSSPPATSPPDEPGPDTGGPSTTTPSTDTGLATETSTEIPETFPNLPAVPLVTQGRWILDAQGQRFKLASVNWYGFEELDHVPAGLEIAHIDDIAAVIAALGFNSVRLPFSLEMVEENPLIEQIPIAANPQLEGLSALEVMDAVIDALARAGLVVILDNHSSEAVWYSTENGLWYTDDYPEEVWLACWRELAWRYAEHPGVVGYDLRNELRNGATWGGPAETDWQAAAGRAGDEILAIDPTKLIVVEGIDYASDLSGTWWSPLELSVPHRLVYSAHDYSWFHREYISFEQLAQDLGSRWGFVIVQDQPFTAPLWVGEFGTCNTAPSCVNPDTSGGSWFVHFTTYLASGDIDWAYWPLNGTMARADDREFGAVDWYGVLNESWSGVELNELIEVLQEIQEPWAFPE